MKRLVGLLVGALCAMALVGLCGTAASATPPSSAPVKFYVVAASVDGAPEYLYEIAERTLGSGSMAARIFALNVGRRQSDGARLEDPTVLHPGWILILPTDASGPDVHTGALPTGVPAPTAAPVGTSAPPISRPAAMATPRHRSESVTVALEAAIVVGSAYLLMAFVGRRRRRRQAASDEVRPVSAAVERRLRPPIRPPNAAAAARPLAVARRPAGAQVLERPAWSANTRILARNTTTPPAAGLRVDVRNHGDTVAVDLEHPQVREARTHLWSSAGRWPGRPMAVCVGRDGERNLYLDLACCPDLVAVRGGADAARRVAVSLARQLHRGGVEVMAVGGVLGAAGEFRDNPANRAAYPQGRRRPLAVFVAAARRDDLDTMRNLGQVSRRRVIRIVLGDTEPALWTLRCDAAYSRARLQAATPARYAAW